jgi:hypothetical protein
VKSSAFNGRQCSGQPRLRQYATTPRGRDGGLSGRRSRRADGRRFLALKEESTGQAAEIIVVENWTAELEREVPRER